MALIPTWPIAAGTLVIGLAVGGIGATWWHSDTISDLELKISKMERDAAVKVANDSNAALADLTAAAKNIKAASETGQVSITTLGTKLDAIDRRYRNAKPPAPLPVDCRPGAERVRRLTEGAAAVNEALARPVPGQ